MRRLFILSTSILIIFLQACRDPKSRVPSDTQTSGSIDISVDETFRPVIEEQLRIFDSSYPQAHITAHYKPEIECFKDFLNGRARLILVARSLTKDEKQVCEQNKIVASMLDEAQDGIAVIVNPSLKDSQMSVDQIKGILKGVYPEKFTVVFDDQGSSTVRYITDTVLSGQKLGANVYAAKSNTEVVNYVANNPRAIGFIGMNYISDPNDTISQGYLSKIRVVSIYNDTLKDFYQPTIITVGLKQYPFTRKIYFVNSDTWVGLGTGFANFLGGARGQLIFKNYNLLPTRLSIVFRESNINPKAIHGAGK